MGDRQYDPDTRNQTGRILRLYDSEEDYAHDVHAVDAARFEAAIEWRREELVGG